MGWQRGKSYYEQVVEKVLIDLSSSIPLAKHFRSTWFSHRLRYDFVLGRHFLRWPDEHGLDTGFFPYFIEVHGEQHYARDYDDRNTVMMMKRCF